MGVWSCSDGGGGVVRDGGGREEEEGEGGGNTDEGLGIRVGKGGKGMWMEGEYKGSK